MKLRSGRGELARLGFLVGLGFALALWAGVAAGFPGGGPGYPNTMIFDQWWPRSTAYVRVMGANGAAAGQLTVDGSAPNGNRLRGPLQSDDDIDSTNSLHVWQHSGSKLTLGDNTLEVGSAACTIQSALNQDLGFSAQGTTKHLIKFGSGDGSTQATSASIDSDGVHLGRAAGQRFDSAGLNFQIGVGGANTEAITIAPGTSGGSVAIKGGTGTTVITATALGGVTIGGATQFNSGLTMNGGSTQLSTLGFGSITLSAGSGTATVQSGQLCVCTDSTANVSVKCAVAATTLTATGTGTDVIKFICMG